MHYVDDRVKGVRFWNPSSSTSTFGFSLSPLSSIILVCGGSHQFSDTRYTAFVTASHPHECSKESSKRVLCTDESKNAFCWIKDVIILRDRTIVV